MPRQEPVKTKSLKTKKSKGAGPIVISAKHAAQFKTLSAEYHASFAPATAEERFLVDLLVNSEWICRQYGRVEAAIWESHTKDGDDSDENSLGAVYCRASEDLDEVDRGLNTAHRRYLTTLKRLQVTQAKRVAAAAIPSLTSPFLVPKS